MDDKNPGNKIDNEINDSALAIGKGYVIGISVIAISTQMVVIPLCGLWIDAKLGTGFIFGAIGFVFGMIVSVLQLIRLASKQKFNKKEEKDGGER